MKGVKMGKTNCYRVQYLRDAGSKWTTYLTFADEQGANEKATELVKKERYQSVRVLLPSGASRLFPPGAKPPPPVGPVTGLLLGYQSLLVLPGTLCGKCKAALGPFGFVTVSHNGGPIICGNCVRG
jgi:hypothetical protein